MKRSLFFLHFILMPVCLLANDADESLPGDVVISEVMADPVGLTELPATEYVEIYNASGNDVPLSGWKFMYDGKETALPDVVLPAGVYAVLYRSGREIQVASGALSLGVDGFPSALANTGKTVGLKNSIGVMIDEIAYPKATAGKSYERSDDGAWHLTTDEKGGTPGAANSPAASPNPDPGTEPEPPVLPEDNSLPGDVVINEVMADPVGLMELPATEYVEIYNASGNDVPLSGWKFLYDGKETALPDVVLPVGVYAVLYRSGREIQVASGALSLGVDAFPSALANTGKTVGLKNSVGVMIDEIAYPKATAGKSYERSDDGAWHLTTDEKGGTPGAANSPAASPNPDPGDEPEPGTEPEPPVLPEDNSLPGDVVINEVMADPVGLTELPATEYVEIYNASGNDVPLSGWKFMYDGKETALPDVVLPAGVYAVLYRSGRDMIVAEGALSLGVDGFPSALANTGKTIGLKNSVGVMIDEIAYPKATAGKSYERSDDGAWHLTTDEKGGTPGAANSSVTPSDPGTEPEPPVLPEDNSLPGDVIINEVMADPVGLTELPATEYVEIYNVSGNDISLSGWKFLYDGKETALPNVVLPAGVYAVLYRSGRDMTVAEGALSLGVDGFPSALANTGKTVGLKNSNGIMIDELAYPKATAGKSYERSDGGAWHSSTDKKGGTPGAVNSPAASPDPTTPTDPKPDPKPEPPVSPEDNSVPGNVIINEVMADPVGLTELPETEYVEIRNVSGKNISLSGWTFVYDGKETALPDVMLPAGVYAVLFRTGRDMLIADGALSLEVDKFPSALANTGKTTGLKNSGGVTIDEVAYPKATRGRSYERSDDGTWHLCTDKKGGTPGALNSSAASSDPTTPTEPEPKPEPPVSPEDHSVPGDVIINEVMADPVGLTELSETEYVEIYNATGDDIPLLDWIFIYDGKESALPDAVLPAGGYAVLYRSGREMIVAEGALSLEVDKFPSALANTGKTIGLKNSGGVTIDEFAYPKATPAKSYERSDDGAWYLSTDKKGGTPGAVNSPASSQEPDIPSSDPENPDPDDEPAEDKIVVEPLGIVINEILPDPFAGGSEYIELYNRSNRPLSLSGLSIAIRRPDGSLSAHYPLSAVRETIRPDSYAVLTKQAGGVADFYFTSSQEAIYETKLPALNNEGATVVLFRTSGETVIDEVSYSEKWHDVSIKNMKGVSLERISPEADSQDPANWTSATAEVGYGTPGYKNSQYRNGDSGNSTFIGTPGYVPGFDYYLLAYRTGKPGYRCRAEVYSTGGKKMAEILNNQLIAQEGEFRWDGKGLDNGRLSPGVYIFYAELYHSDGNHVKIKKAFLVK
ncbi:MAG: lamin tail domain-containing protein [Tannerella sp.]|jgi:hypothetical protein|nr:lamin tail domain-containing protein [Tannerella sp.]